MHSLIDFLRVRARSLTSNMAVINEKIWIISLLVVLAIIAIGSRETSASNSAGLKETLKKLKPHQLRLFYKNQKHKKYVDVSAKTHRGNFTEANFGKLRFTKMQSDRKNSWKIGEHRPPEPGKVAFFDNHRKMNRFRRDTLANGQSNGENPQIPRNESDAEKRGNEGVPKKNYKKFRILDIWSKKSVKGKEEQNGEDARRVSKRSVDLLRRHDGKFVSSAENRSKMRRFRREVSSAGKRRSEVNSTDYYAQRKAVMERFYARQREIAEKYAKQGSTTPKSWFKNDQENADRNGTYVRNDVQRENATEEVTEKTVLDNSTNLDSKYDKQWENSVAGGFDSQKESPVISFDSGPVSEAKAIYSEGNSNVQRSVSYLKNCTNIPLSGQFSPKARTKITKCVEERRGDIENPDDRISSPKPVNDENTSGHQQWGDCKGKIVYQHNLSLGLKGPSNLDTLFEAIIQGPICITCVEATRYNETRAIVSLDSGGRGYNYVKLKLKGFENEGFSYIIKVWGVRKTGEDCKDDL